MAIPDKFKWARYHIDPWWNTDYINLPYVNEPFNDPAALDRWKKKGWTQTKFTGDIYDMRNPEPGWIDGFRKYFPWDHFSWAVYRMTPGVIIPEHSDTFAKFKKIHNIKNFDQIFRAVIFVENWKQGHYLDIDGTPITEWKAGDTIIWKYNLPHTAANIGSDDRYTIQITGLVNENIFVE